MQTLPKFLLKTQQSKLFKKRKILSYIFSPRDIYFCVYISIESEDEEAAAEYAMVSEPPQSWLTEYLPPGSLLNTNPSSQKPAQEDNAMNKSVTNLWNMHKSPSTSAAASPAPSGTATPLEPSTPSNEEAPVAAAAATTTTPVAAATSTEPTTPTAENTTKSKKRAKNQKESSAAKRPKSKNIFEKKKVIFNRY